MSQVASNMLGNYAGDRAAQRVASFWIAANSQLVGYWQGSSSGIMRFAAGASTFHGVNFNGAIATHSGWGIPSYGNKARRWQGYGDMGGFPWSSHLVARRLGSLPVELMGTSAETSMEWTVGYLSGFPSQLSIQLNLPQPEAPSKSAHHRPMSDDDAQPPQLSPPQRGRSEA